MVSIITWSLAAFFYAISCLIEDQHAFDASRLRKLPVQFWLKSISRRHMPKVFNFILDAWHIARLFTLLCIIGTVVFFQKDWQVRSWQDEIFYTVMAWVIWHFVFWLFYSIIFKVKK